MKLKIDDFWVLTKTGVLIYNYSTDKKCDEQFFGMLLSAISAFADQISDGGLSKFDLADKRFLFIEKNDIIFLGCSRSNLKEKMAKKDLENIMKVFFKMYPHDIINTWKGSFEIFSTFKTEMDKMKKIKNKQ